MRKHILVLIGSLFVVKSYAQYNYYRLSAGPSIGTNLAFADLDKKRPAQTFGGNIDYNITPFMSFGMELQKGTLTGGDIENDDNHRFFKNSYTSLTFGGKLQLGQIVDFESNNLLYAIRGLYSGIGVGVIKNNMTEIVRDKPNDPENYRFPGKDKSTNIAIPINAGINFNILDRWGYTRYIFNINYQLNVTLGEGLDGYNDASKNSNSGTKAFSNIPDMYGVASVGLKVCFGPEGLY